MITAMHALGAAARANDDVDAAGAVFPRLCCLSCCRTDVLWLGTNGRRHKHLAAGGRQHIPGSGQADGGRQNKGQTSE